MGLNHEAYHVLVERGVRHLLVTDQAGQAVGIVSNSDFRFSLGLDFFRRLRDSVRAVMQDRVPVLAFSDSLQQALNAMQTRILPVTPFEQNCTLLWDEDSRIGAVVDPGGEVPRILAAIQEEGLHIEKILVTHGHIDHAGGVADLAEALQVPVEGPQEEDRFWLEGMPLQAERFGFPPVRSFTPDRWLAQGDQVRVGPLTLEVLHCPGHTPGHGAA